MIAAKDTKAKPSPAEQAVSAGKRRGRGQRADLPMKYVLIAGGVVVLIVVLLFTVFSHGGSNGPASASRSGTAGGQSAPHRSVAGARSQARGSTPRSTAAEPSPLSTEPAPRQRPTAASRAARTADRTQRTPATDSRRSSNSASMQVTAITEGSALIGSRSVHVGDMIGGCLIKDISADRVLVEFSGSTYSLRAGDALPR